MTRLGPEVADVRHVRYVPQDGDADERAANWGNNKHPDGLLDPASEYEVERVEVHSWHTKVWLVGVGGPFNSVHFVEVA